MRTTEQSSRYDHLEKMSTREILTAINAEDRTVPVAVARAMDKIEALVDGIVERMRRGGRVFYLGAGTSGRIAGGDRAIRNAVEAAEDKREGGWADMQPFQPTVDDVVIGIAASGTTPYVIGAVEIAREKGMLTGCITCNEDSPLAAATEIPIVVVVGPEFVTGSTRMKAGTAQKLVLNMISTSVMIRLGHVRGSKMVDMQLTNHKLVDRGTRMIMEETGIEDYDYARKLLLEYGQVRAAVTAYQNEKKDA